MTQTGHNRTINRRKFLRSELEAALDHHESLPHQVFTRYRQLLAARTGDRAFHPNAAQEIVHLDPAIFSFVRTATDGGSRVLCLHNVSARAMHLKIAPKEAGIDGAASVVDLIGGAAFRCDAALELTVPPYGVFWLRATP